MYRPFGTREEAIAAVTRLIGPVNEVFYDVEAIADDLMEDSNSVRGMSDFDIVMRDHPRRFA